MSDNHRKYHISSDKKSPSNRRRESRKSDNYTDDERDDTRLRSKHNVYSKYKGSDYYKSRPNDNDYRSKKKSKKSRHYSSDSSSSSEDEVRLLKRLETERKKQKEARIKKKELMKANETHEEKRIRRLNKKEAKERKRKEKMGWDNEYIHFTNADNPYGDSNLLDTFMWEKKLKNEGLDTLSKEEIQQRNRANMEENRIELEKVKKRRHERELERADRENMMEQEMRQKEAAQFSQFSKQEDSFQLEQARIRSQIRLQDGRAKAIDLLAQYVSSEGDVTAVDMHEPYSHLTGLTLKELEDLLEDIKIYQQLEQEHENQSYWQDLTIIVQDELRRLRQRDLSSIEDASINRQGIHASIAKDVSQVFSKKSVAELSDLQINIENKLSGSTVGLDVGYWESLLSQLKAHQARARLRERHRDNLRQKLAMLKAEQGVKEDIKAQKHDQEKGDDDGEEKDTGSNSGMSDSENVVPCVNHVNKDDESMIGSAIALYQAGRFSPKLLRPKDLEPGTVLLDAIEDEQALIWARQRITKTGKSVESGLSAQEKLMQKEAQKSMSTDEVQFSVEAKLDPQQYLWSDKYRPRKPRYFNRVHTGFEWNKYNQTHYDMDNPPPKIVQGYKFNIFFPDLIEKSKTPQYELIPCDDNQDFALLKFTAGPPYEDIAFKIVSREWEYSYKRGFRCQFHNNIFQLWFHFKRYRYRR